VAFIFRNQRYIVERAYGPWFSSGDWWGAEWWSVEKWDLTARADGSPNADSVLCCCLARHPMKQDWRIEALYD
jgi:protein ImuB